jgi:phospholipid/cholesterol/gamma-HCH transport system substrate-binding protein
VSTEAKVGVFVTAAIVLVAATIYFVRATQTVRGQVEFRTYFRDAGGLDTDATVLFGGIKVGRITSVRPWTADPTRIEVLFEVKSETPLNGLSIARVGSVTLMGSPALLISTGSNDAPRLKAKGVVPSEEQMSMSEITRRVEMVAESANAVLVDLRREIPTLTGQLEDVLGNVKAITSTQNQRELRVVLARTSALLKDADDLVASAHPVVSNLDRTVTNVNRTVDAVRDPLVDDLTSLRRTVDEARTLIDSLQGVVRTNQEDFSETLGALRTTAENLRAFSETVKQRPWNVVRTTQPEDRKVPR